MSARLGCGRIEVDVLAKLPENLDERGLVVEVSLGRAQLLAETVQSCNLHSQVYGQINELVNTLMEEYLQGMTGERIFVMGCQYMAGNSMEHSSVRAFDLNLAAALDLQISSTSIASSATLSTIRNWGQISASESRSFAP